MSRPSPPTFAPSSPTTRQPGPQAEAAAIFVFDLSLPRSKYLELTGRGGAVEGVLKRVVELGVPRGSELRVATILTSSSPTHPIIHQTYFLPLRTFLVDLPTLSTFFSPSPLSLPSSTPSTSSTPSASPAPSPLVRHPSSSPTPSFRALSLNPRPSPRWRTSSPSLPRPLKGKGKPDDSGLLDGLIASIELFDRHSKYPFLTPAQPTPAGSPAANSPPMITVGGSKLNPGRPSPGYASPRDDGVGAGGKGKGGQVGMRERRIDRFLILCSARDPELGESLISGLLPEWSISTSPPSLDLSTSPLPLTSSSSSSLLISALKSSGGILSPSPSPEDKDSQGNIIPRPGHPLPRRESSESVDSMGKPKVLRGRSRVRRNWSKEMDGVGWGEVGGELGRRRVAFGVVVSGSTVPSDGEEQEGSGGGGGVLGNVIATMDAGGEGKEQEQEQEREAPWWKLPEGDRAIMRGFRKVVVGGSAGGGETVGEANVNGKREAPPSSPLEQDLLNEAKRLRFDPSQSRPTSTTLNPQQALNLARLSQTQNPSQTPQQAAIALMRQQAALQAGQAGGSGLPVGAGIVPQQQQQQEGQQQGSWRAVWRGRISIRSKAGLPMDAAPMVFATLPDKANRADFMLEQWPQNFMAITGIRRLDMKALGDHVAKKHCHIVHLAPAPDPAIPNNTGLFTSFVDKMASSQYMYICNFGPDPKTGLVLVPIATPGGGHRLIGACFSRTIIPDNLGPLPSASQLHSQPAQQQQVQRQPQQQPMNPQAPTPPRPAAAIDTAQIQAYLNKAGISGVNIENMSAQDVYNLLHTATANMRTSGAGPGQVRPNISTAQAVQEFLGAPQNQQQQQQNQQHQQQLLQMQAQQRLQQQQQQAQMMMAKQLAETQQQQQQQQMQQMQGGMGNGGVIDLDQYINQGQQYYQQQ